MKTHKYLDEILEICKNKHLTVEEISELLKEKEITAGVATIYRWVKHLVKNWKMRKIEWINKTNYYETLCEPHIHFIDEETGQILDLPMDKISLPDWIFDKISDIRIIWKIKK